MRSLLHDVCICFVCLLVLFGKRGQDSRIAGDYGDFDLRQAVDTATAGGRAPALVTFGHMHQSLHKRYGAGSRNMVHIDQATGLLCFPADGRSQTCAREAYAFGNASYHTQGCLNSGV